MNQSSDIFSGFANLSESSNKEHYVATDPDYPVVLERILHAMNNSMKGLLIDELYRL